MTKEPEAYIADFLDFLRAVRGYSAHTVQSYALALSQMTALSQWHEEAEGWTLDIMPFRFKIADKSKKTIALRLSAIRSFVKYLDTQCGLVVKLTGDASIKTPQTLPKPIEETYIQEVLESAAPQERLLVSLLYGLGLRISELSTLRLDQISPAWIEVTGKGRKSRQIPLLPALQVLLDAYITQAHPKHYLFEKEGEALSTGQVRYRVQKLFAKHGIKATPHQLRHSFATHLLHHGARISDVSELLGHSSMATTQVYTKLASSKKMETYMQAHPLAELSAKIRN